MTFLCPGGSGENSTHRSQNSYKSMAWVAGEPPLCHAGAEVALRRRRGEHALPRAEPPQRFQRLARGADQGVRARRGLHAGRRAHEQQIAQLLARPRQPDAHRRLAHGQLLRRIAAAGLLAHRPWKMASSNTASSRWRTRISVSGIRTASSASAHAAQRGQQCRRRHGIDGGVPDVRGDVVLERGDPCLTSLIGAHTAPALHGTPCCSCADAFKAAGRAVLAIWPACLVAGLPIQRSLYRCVGRSSRRGEMPASGFQASRSIKSGNGRCWILERASQPAETSTKGAST